MSLPASYNETIDFVCESYKATFVLWDGAFALASKVKPSSNDITDFQEFVVADVDVHKSVGCRVTHKLHLMMHQIHWQMATTSRTGLISPIRPEQKLGRDGGGSTTWPYVMSVGQSKSVKTHIRMLWLMAME